MSRRRKRRRRATILTIAIGALAYVGWAVLAQTGNPAERTPSTTSVWTSPSRCREALAERAAALPSAPLRIATWNLRWFPNGSPDPNEGLGTDVEWVACLIAVERFDAVGLQEIVQSPAGRNAILDLTAKLDAIAGGRWRSDFDECPSDGRQHVGWIWNDARVDVAGVATEHALHPLTGRCRSQLRPGLAARFRARSGPDFTAIVVHLDSGTTARDAGNRIRSLERLPEVAERWRRATSDDDLIVLGDLNSMGCRRCTPELTPDAERAENERRLDAAGLRSIPITPACTEYYRGRGVLLDAIAASRSMTEASRRAEARGPCAEARCERTDDHAEYFDRVSDHCPVVLELGTVDDDGPPAPAGGIDERAKAL